MAKTRAGTLTLPVTHSIGAIQEDIINCSRCSRLRDYCSEVAQIKRKSYLKDQYWGKPIAGFGTQNANLVIIGLAPAAHGANRTGRVFTGDRSGDWLYRALFKAGFANQPQAHNIDDGLILNNCYITCAVKCAPPDNKPTPAELETCGFHLERELQALTEVKVFVALGQIAYKALWTYISKRINHSNQPSTDGNTPASRRPDFKHGAQISLPGNQSLLLSYHPSQQNTFTGRLTEPMFDGIFNQVKVKLAEQRHGL
ncbi:MAG: uracil-DNA glycosylase [Bdellovibrionia bacterium]